MSRKTNNQIHEKIMNTKTLEAITRHGESLLRAFPNATEKNPVALCKKLRRIETSIAPIILRNCNEGVPDNEMDAATDKALSRAKLLLGEPMFWWNDCPIEIFMVNRDPRGYALKLSSEWTENYNRGIYADYSKGGLHYRRPIYTDMGGYGILAPDLNTK